MTDVRAAQAATTEITVQTPLTPPMDVQSKQVAAREAYRARVVLQQTASANPWHRFFTARIVPGREGW